MPMPMPVPIRDRLVPALHGAAMAGALLILALKAVDAAPRLILALMELIP